MRKGILILGMVLIIVGVIALGFNGTSEISNTGNVSVSPNSISLPYVTGYYVLSYGNSVNLNFSASTYVYGYSTSGISPASPFVNGSFAVGVGANGCNDTGMAITSSHQNSYNPYENSHYTIGGIGVSDFTNYKTFYKVNTPPIQPITVVNLTFNVSSNSLVVFAGMGGGAYSIGFSGIPNIHIASILNSSGDTGLEFAYANLSAGKYTISEKSTNGDGGSNDRSEIVSAIVFTTSTQKPAASGTSNTWLYGIVGGVIAVAVVGSMLAIMRKKK